MDNYRQTINSLSHKQLLWLLEQYHNLELDVNKVLLETSKDRLKWDNAINLISKFFSYCQSVFINIGSDIIKWNRGELKEMSISDIERKIGGYIKVVDKPAKTG